MIPGAITHASGTPDSRSLFFTTLVLVQGLFLLTIFTNNLNTWYLVDAQ